MENSLTIKTKIAAWWIIIIGICPILLGSFFVIFPCSMTGCFGFVLGLLLVFLGLLICFIGRSLLLGKKWAWWVVRVVYWLIAFSWIGWLLSMITKFDFFGLLIAGILSLIIGGPLILLELDRKNFFKVAK